MNDEVTSLKFQLAGTLRKWLEQLSADSGRSLAEEIRQQLATAYRLDGDRPTRELCEDVFLLAREVKMETGENWYDDDRSKAVFTHAVVEHIMNNGQEDAPYRRDPDRADTEEGMLGRTIARMFRRR